MMRVGMGYDVHRLTAGRKLVMGGEVIPHDQGLLGHSDADVLTHAVCDALLGAAGLGDIGHHFPNSDPRFKGVRSILLLEKVREKIQGKGFSVGNVDATILAEAPRFAPFREKMERNIALALQVEPSRVNVKASTTEGLGWEGAGQGIAALCIVMLSGGRG